MDYTLMHKDIPVIDLEIDATGFISKILKVHDERHLPMGIHIFATGIDRKGLNDWWLGRSIPASRMGLADALDILGFKSPTPLIEKCYGLSLSDQYWICPKSSDLKWENINFFTNDFTRDVGEALFGNEPTDKTEINLVSPDNTSDGWLRKKWIIINGKRVLMKGGSGVFQQEPFNEVIASAIMSDLNIAHVDYTQTFDGEKPYSLCENFITQTTELIPAWRILDTVKRVNSDSDFTHFLRCSDKLEIPKVADALNKMIAFDFLIANEDRHYNNFGFIRNAETLEWIEVAPIFDSGTSLWYNTTRVGSRVESKPFKKSHDEQIKLVTDLKWFDASALSGVDVSITEILKRSQDIDYTRSSAIAKYVLERANICEGLSRHTSSARASAQKLQPLR
jgi:hypothetical protein